MKMFTTFLLSVCGAAALAAHAPAQQITAADKARYAEFLKTCAPQLAAMKKEMAAHGESATEQELRQFFEATPAQSREVAQQEGVSVAAALREVMARFRAEMADPENPDPSVKIAGPTVICFLELLIDREARQPTVLPAPEPQPASAAPGADSKLQAFRRICAGEANKVGAVRGQDYLTPARNGMAPMDEFYTQFSSDQDSRETAKAQFHQTMEADTSAFHRANMGLAACAIFVTESAAIGIPANVMERMWLQERVDVYALDEYAAEDAAREAAPARRPAARTPAPVPAPPPAPAPARAPVSTAVVVANSGGCLTIDWRGGPQGDPAVLSNICGNAINVGVCVKTPTPGSASEDISCELSRFTSYRIGGHSSVTMPATHGTVQSRVCTPPQMPAMWWENGNSIGNCR